MTTRRQQVFEHYVVPEIPVLAHAAIALTQQPADAEDLVQDTLVRAFLGAGRFDGQYPRAWLLTILRNTWAKQSRRHRPELLHDPDSELVGKAAPVVPSREIPEAVVLSEEFHAAVEAAFNALPAKLRSAIALIAIRKLSYAEAARTLGIPLGTVMSRVHHARAFIRCRLAAEEGSGEGEDNQPTPQLSVSRSGGTGSSSRQTSAAGSTGTLPAEPREVNGEPPSMLTPAAGMRGGPRIRLLSSVPFSLRGDLEAFLSLSEHPAGSSSDGLVPEGCRPAATTLGSAVARPAFAGSR